MRKRILPYGPSNSARNLARATGLIRIRLSGTRFHPRPDDLIINWGNSSWNPQTQVRWINNPMSVEIASSKIHSLTAMKEGGVNVPEFTTDRETVQRWLSEDKRVLARTLDRASGGRGIILLSSGESIPQARLYTLYIPKYDEYRVHVWGDQVLDIQQKRRRNGVDEINSQIRNASNGWVFCREGVNCPEQCVDQARRAVAALGLDFGAVDVGFTRRGNIATVYEVNTAPGIEGTTLSVYANKLLSL